MVHKNVTILLRLVNQILDFRKYENGKLELVLSNIDLRAQLQEWSGAFRALALKKHIHFILDVGNGQADYKMALDAEKMERIYFNVLSNAFKFTPENGSIVVTLSAIAQADGKEYARLVVSDSGSLAQRSVVSRETINSFLNAMPDGEGQCKIFDVNLRQGFYTKEILCNSMKRCNILKINDEELVTVSRMFGYPGIDLQDKCWILLAKYNLKMLILTCGVNGSYVFTPGEISFVETPKVEVADTVGAGDSFTATFVAAILKGKPVAEAHKLAVEVSAYVCTQNGAMPELPVRLKERLM